MRTRPIYVLAGALLALSACGSSSSSYGESSTYRTTTPGYSNGTVADSAILDLVWDSQTARDRASICAEVRVRGAYSAARVITEEATEFSTAEVARKLEEWC
jgi:hypothetical protein